MNRKQSGMTMIGFLITLAVVMLFVYCGMKIMPMYTEFYSVKQALAGMASRTGASAIASKEKIRMLFKRRMDMSYANTVLKMDPLKIEATDTGYMLTVDYERPGRADRQPRHRRQVPRGTGVGARWGRVTSICCRRALLAMGSTMPACFSRR